MAVNRENPIKVSVVVAIYNSEKYLEQTIGSICAQTLKEIEIICVDDGSTDGSVGVLEKLAANDGRIKILHQTEKSDGAALARNMGVSCAVGEYVSVLDSDDFFEPNMLEKAYSKAKNTGAEVIIFDGDIYDEALDTIRETGMILRKEFLPENRDVFAPADNAQKLFFMTIGAAWNVLFSKELIRRENLKFQSFHHADDLGFVYLGFATARTIAILQDKLVHYRCNNPNSQAANLEKWPEAAAGAFVQLKQALESKGIFDTFQVTFTEMALHYFELYLSRMASYSAYENLYLSWKNRYKGELALEQIPGEEFNQKRLAQIRRCLCELSPGQYLFDREKGNGLFAGEDAWRQVIPEQSRIIVYGAGKRGKEIFVKIIESGCYELVAWSDKKYQEMGYPIVSPEGAMAMEFDFILVAIESKNIYDKIKADLIQQGGNPDRIVWMGE